MTTHTHSITVPTPVTRPEASFKMGTATSPTGPAISADSISLLRDGKPWLAVMGEIHYSRVENDQWRDELLKMKSGGIDIIATYIFWIHHEEIEGQFDFAGDRDLRKFAQTCREVGLPLIVRCGPWCHGEVRNGGMPDWILTKPNVKNRSSDPAFLDYARALYRQIKLQLDGLLWKDGGPVVGLQVDNEFGGPGEYLLDLKTIAIEEGLDVPLYTRTGWPTTSTPMPFGELLPLYGAYAEGFWAREIEPMPGDHWRAFTFEIVRTDVEVGADMLGKRAATDEIDTAQYPYLTCELGGGMEQSYHRRVFIHPMDVLAVAITKIGSGGNLPGYYMYHGGTNPKGKLSTLQESQATKYWNDSPVKSYDFQAPLGQYGQVRSHYHMLRRLHLMLQDYGQRLASMTPSLPKQRPQEKTDVETLRWAIRSQGNSGFLFVNNYQRLSPMPSRPGVQFEIGLPGETLKIPETPTTIAADSALIWPFNLDLGGALLKFATAELICEIDDDDGTRYVVFGKTNASPVQFAFAKHGAKVSVPRGELRQTATMTIIDDVKSSLDAAVSIVTDAGKTIHIILLDDQSSLRCWKLDLGDQKRVILSDANLVADGGKLRATTDLAGSTSIAVLPPIVAIHVEGDVGGQTINSKRDGLFSVFSWDDAATGPGEVTLSQVRPAGPLRTIKNGFANVSEAPDDADFDNAAVWKIAVDPVGADVLLRIDYVGDVARLYAGGEFITDNFFNGRPFELSLKAIPPALLRHGLELRILPLQRGAAIYLLPQFWNELGDSAAVAIVRSVKLVNSRTVTLSAGEK